ncbi:hypothetical protein NMD95_11190 [Edwardsiella tarda]
MKSARIASGASWVSAGAGTDSALDAGFSRCSHWRLVRSGSSTGAAEGEWADQPPHHGDESWVAP